MKKINLGLILTATLILFVTCYITYEETAKSKDRKNVMVLAQEFLNISAKYMVLDEKYLDTDMTVNDPDYLLYLEEMKQELSSYIEQKSLQPIYEYYKKNLDDQVQGKYKITYCQNNIIKLMKITFDDDYIFAYLGVSSPVEIDKKQRNSNQMEHVVGKPEYPSLFILKKVNNSYVITHHYPWMFHLMDMNVTLDRFII